MSAKPKSESSAAQAPSPPEKAPPDGLFLVGQVVGRARREFKLKSGGSRYNISLSVLTHTGLYKPERWTDSPSPTDIPKVGETVNLAIALQYFTGKSGTGVRLLWGPPPDGDQF